MCSMPTQTGSVSLAEIDALIADHHRGLLESRNSFVLANRLPEHVLLNIFQLVVDPVGGAHHIAAVCRHWRLLTLTTPNLWAYITVTHHTPEDVVKEWISRSQDMALTVSLNRLRDENKNEQVPPILPSSVVHTLSQLHKFRDLSIFASTSETSLILVHHLNVHGDAPLLQSLTIQCPESPIKDVESWPLANFRASSLHSLCMKFYLIGYQSPILTSIKRLEVSVYQSGEAWHKHHWMYIASKLTALEHLSITNMCFWNWEQWDHPSSPSRPLLHSLHVTDNWTAYRPFYNFVQNFDLQALKKLSMVSTYANLDESALQETVALLQPFFQRMLITATNTSVRYVAVRVYSGNEGRGYTSTLRLDTYTVQKEKPIFRFECHSQ
jgi:hypothetical protein